MYNSDRLKRIDDETFSLRISKDKDFRILQLTDLHLGFGMISRKRISWLLKLIFHIHWYSEIMIARWAQPVTGKN